MGWSSASEEATLGGFQVTVLWDESVSPARIERVSVVPSDWDSGADCRAAALHCLRAYGGHDVALSPHPEAGEAPGEVVYMVRG